MENLEKLKAWVDKTIPQRQERLANYVNLVHERVGEFIIDFQDMDSREATNSYINFANDFSNLNKDQNELFTLVKLRDMINDIENSEELLKELIRQRKLHFEVANRSFTLSNFDNAATDIYNVDFGVELRKMNYHVAHIKTLTRAIYILEGKTEE